MTTGPAEHRTDYAALTDAVGPAEVTAFTRSAKANGTYSSASGAAQIVAVVIVVVVGSVFALTFLGAVGGVILSAVNSGAPAATLLVPIVIAAAVVVGIVVLARWYSRKRWETLFRLDGFARANGMVFSPRDAAPSYPGAIFSSGRSRESRDHLRSATGRFLDYGNYRYITGSGKNQTTHNWGFLAFQLDRSLPHLVLDSRANNGLFGGTNLPAAFQKEQVLSLEGDFDNYFTLYCPRAYERDALYVFTPDLMALLIDNAAPFDVEIIDKWMFVYSATRFDMTQPAVHHRLLSIVDTVGAKTVTQTDRYSDERVQDFSANVVGPEGQRLKRRFPVAAIVIVAVVLVGFFVFPLLTGVIATLGR